MRQTRATLETRAAMVYAPELNRKGSVAAQTQYKLIALDLDGTVLHADGSPSPRVCAAIAKAIDAGYRLSIATGRNHTESRAIVEKLGIRHECIFVGGAMVVDGVSGKMLHRTVMHSELAAELCKVFEGLGHAALALQDTCETGLDYLITGDIPIHYPTRNWLNNMKMEVKYIPSLATHDHRHTLRVSMCCDTRDVARIMPAIQERFGGRTTLHSLHVPGMQCEMLEAFDPAVNKWRAVHYVAKRHGIEPNQIIAVGDDMNDVHMIEHAGLGVAMGNAREPLKAIADRIIGPNTEDGLAVFLEELVDGKVVPAA
jgi:hypothetical protein